MLEIMMMVVIVCDWIGGMVFLVDLEIFVDLVFVIWLMFMVCVQVMVRKWMVLQYMGLLEEQVYWVVVMDWISIEEVCCEVYGCVGVEFLEGDQ